jgi:hypothetical protein
MLGPQERRHVNTVIAAIVEGEFDATKAESDRWAASTEGQARMRQLLEGR